MISTPTLNKNNTNVNGTDNADTNDDKNGNISKPTKTMPIITITIPTIPILASSMLFNAGTNHEDTGNGYRLAA